MGVIFEHLVKERGATIEQARLALQAWDVKPIFNNGLQVGEYMMQQNEVHFALHQDYRLKLGRIRLMRTLLSELLDKHGFLITRLFKNDKYIKLIEYVGFKKTHEDANYIYFWLDKESCKCLP